ncbi:MAG: transketolase family protein [Oscillibacter sp.]|nr:transketolase family protein [Oscillibacter sp.]
MYKVVSEIKPEKAEMRVAFAAVMDELAAADPAVAYFDCDVINSTGMVEFCKKYPDRGIDCGIQEANMISVAAGASAVGMKPFTQTFGPFAARRVIDQVYISAAYAKLNVRMFGTDAGITASYNGGTHMPIEDMGLMRAIPDVTLLEPADSVMLADLMRQTKDRYGVFYFRTTRKVTDQIYEEGSTFEIGKAALLREGTDAAIIVSGYCTSDALAAADALAAEGLSVRVLNMFTWKPIDREAIAAAARETGAIVTVENHNILTGLGSAVAEVLCETCPAPLHRVGVPDRFGEVGSVDYLKKLFGMTKDDIIQAVRTVLARKK